MASSNPNSNINNISASSFDPTTSPANTTFVQADPTTFRAVVQRLTGATLEPKLPLTPAFRSDNIAPRRPAFKLQDRRQVSRNLHIKLNNGYGSFAAGLDGSGTSNSPSSRQRTFRGFNAEMLMASPVSPFDLFSRNSSPKTPMSPLEEEEKAIAEKGFYFHPSPLSTPRGSGSAAEPELLPLFPLHSPRD